MTRAPFPVSDCPQFLHVIAAVMFPLFRCIRLISCFIIIIIFTISTNRSIESGSTGGSDHQPALPVGCNRIHHLVASGLTTTTTVTAKQTATSSDRKDFVTNWLSHPKTPCHVIVI
jgi:hypothetical protein